MSTLNELKEWIEQGGKIRLSDWDKGVFIKKQDNDIDFENGKGVPTGLPLEWALADDWEKVEEKPVRWEPGYGKSYYLVNQDCTTIVKDYWLGTPADKVNLETFNCFKTKEEARQAAALWLAERELRNLADGGRWCIRYDTYKKDFIPIFAVYVGMDICFSSSAKAIQAIKQLGEEKLKLILGVK